MPHSATLFYPTKAGTDMLKGILAQKRTGQDRGSPRIWIGYTHFADHHFWDCKTKHGQKLGAQRTSIFTNAMV